MAINQDINKVFIQDIYDVYSNADTIMLEKLAKHTSKGITNTSLTDASWVNMKAAETAKVSQDLNKTIKQIDKMSQSKIDAAIKSAYAKGFNSANGDFNLARALVSDINVPYKIQNIIAETNNIITNSHMKILREATDAYREVVSEVSSKVLTGTVTRRQVAQETLNKFADKGITGFVDKAGRRWEMATYAEMAVRTATGRAAITGHLDRQQEIGRDLVIISDHPAECQLCRPWEGRVLSISGNDPVHPSLDSAIAAGLFHPNCRHTLTGYIPGLTKIQKGKPDPEGYKLSQQQRHNERQIRKWKRRESVAIEPDAKLKSSNKVKEWQKKQRELLKGTNVRRKYERESIKLYKGAVNPTPKPKPIKKLTPVPHTSKKLPPISPSPVKITPTNINTSNPPIILKDKVKNKVYNENHLIGQWTGAGNLDELEDSISSFINLNAASNIDEVSTNILKGKTVLKRVEDMTQSQKDSLQILGLIDDAVPENKILYRVTNNIDDMQIGEDITLGITNFSKSKAFMDDQMDYFGINSGKFVIKIEGKTKSINVQGYSPYPTKQESLTAGKFRVKDINVNSGKYGQYNYTEVILEQIDESIFKDLQHINVMQNAFGSNYIKVNYDMSIPDPVKNVVKKQVVSSTDFVPLTREESRESINKAKEWFNNLSDREITNSFRTYTTGDYTTINNYFRANQKLEQLDIRYQRTITTMLDTFRTKKLPLPFEKPTELYRATGHSYIKNALANESREFQNKIIDKINSIVDWHDNIDLTSARVKLIEDELNTLLANRVVREKGFTSTAFEQGTYGRASHIQLTIKADPKKAKAINIDGISAYQGESEILFAPNMENQIERVYFEKTSDYKNALRIVVKNIGHDSF